MGARPGGKGGDGGGVGALPGGVGGGDGGGVGALPGGKGGGEGGEDDGGTAADDYDPQRGQLPSDDEEGPHDPDAEADALPPGDVDPAGDPMDVEDEADAAAVEQPAPSACPPLPAVLGSLKNAELQEQLRWRGLTVGGNKPVLLARLEKAVADGVDVLNELPDRAGRAAAAQVAESARWEAVDAAKVQRPTYTGADKFEPKPELGFTPQTHPFEYMQTFYPRSVRDTIGDQEQLV